MMQVRQELSIGLIRSAQAGHADARQRLFEICGPPVAKLVECKVGRRIRGYVEHADVAQEVLLSMHRSLDDSTFDSVESFFRWIGAVTDNCIRRVWRHMTAQKRDGGVLVPLVAGENGLPELEPEDDSPPPEAVVIGEELVRLVRGAVAGLEDRCRSVLGLVLTHGRAWPIVSVKLENSPSVDAARMRYHRAIERLRVALRSEGLRE